MDRSQIEYPIQKNDGGEEEKMEIYLVPILWI